jgi:hypothetical protein
MHAGIYTRRSYPETAVSKGGQADSRQQSGYAAAVPVGCLGVACAEKLARQDALSSKQKGHVLTKYESGCPNPCSG